jgi:trimethylamine:corrinoid methyltransferase-like protein
VTTQTAKKRFGNPELYAQIHQDAIMLIESYGFAASPPTSQKILAAMAPEQVEKINYSEDLGRIYISRDVIESSIELIRQGMDFFPRGFGTGGMAAYIVDQDGPRSPMLEDMNRLADIYGQSDLLTSLQSSFNVLNGIKRKDLEGRARVECQAIDYMVQAAGGKLVLPTIYTDAGYDRLRAHYEAGRPAGAALSIIATYMTVSDEMVDPFIKTTTRGLPFIMNSMPIGGLTGPYTMSSLTTLAHAEALFGMVLGQLICPGIKCLNSAMPTIANMAKKDMPMMFGSVANTMVNVLLAELNLHLGIPCCQSSCGHHRDLLDDEAMAQCAKIYSLVNQYDFYIMRHMFGFSAQINDFSIENMKKQMKLYQEITENPVPVEIPEPAQYDEEGLEAIFEGLARQDFRVLDHTLRNIGKSFNC